MSSTVEEIYHAIYEKMLDGSFTHYRQLAELAAPGTFSYHPDRHNSPL